MRSASAIVAGVLIAWGYAVPTRATPAAPVTDTSRSPFALARPVGLGEVEWTDGFWSARSTVNREQTLPTMWRLMRDSRYKPFFEHFLIAAGAAEGAYHGAPWNDGDFYKWIEAACSSLGSRPQDAGQTALRAAVDEAVRAVVAAQRPDGYLHTPVLIAARNGDLSATPLADRADFEVYNLGHLMTAGCIHYRATGDRALLEAGERAAGFLENVFADPSPAIARQAVCPSHYMGLVELHRTTGDSRWLQLAQRVIELRDVAAGVDGGGGDDNQDRMPFLLQREAVGHAVRANYLYAGAADLYLETGDRRLLAPLDAVWDNVTQKKLSVIGACGALFDGASPDASPDQNQITRVHQAYGRNYQLPSLTAHNETCAAVGAVLWNWRRFLATGESRFVDWMELALHNAVLSGVSLDGQKYFYTNPLRVVEEPPTDLRWSRIREDFLVSFCCPPNVARTLAQIGGYAYSIDESGVWLNLYGANRLDTHFAGSSLRLRQKTSYPWDGEIRVLVDAAPATPVELRFRVPGWARGDAQLLPPQRFAAASAELAVHRRKGYQTARAVWRQGDELVFRIPMPVVVLESHPLVEETRNEVAVQRGPIVYCLESVDLPSGVRLDEIGINPRGDFRHEYAANLLGGVTAIDAPLVVSRTRPWGELYRPVENSAAESLRGRLVPYFAWGNRGKSEMTVWLPRR